MLKIIRAKEKHISSIVGIWKELMDFHRVIDPFFTRSLNAHLHFETFLRDMIKSDKALVLAAEYGDDILGYSISRILQYPPVFVQSRYGCIYDVAVKQGHLRKGIGSCIVKKNFEWFDRKSITRIELRAIYGNEVSCSFWKKMGFKLFSHTMVIQRPLKAIKSEKQKSPKASHQYSAKGCPFCEKLKTSEVLLKNELAFAVLDQFPVTKGHTLVLPLRHMPDYFDLSDMERIAMENLIIFRRNQLLKEDRTIQGFNVGVNCGHAAGQTILHCHLHLIPRRKGDTPDPKGGVRGVIPGKMQYN